MTEEEGSKEAYAYTPGLKVKQAEIVTKERRLPIHGQVFVKEGDEVDYETIIARAELSGDPEVIRASNLLNADPIDIKRYVTRKEGEKIEEGELLAHLSMFFGLVKKNVYSPISGTIETISEFTGQIVIRGLPIPVEVEAYIPGKIVEILPREGAVIETNAAIIQGIFGIGGETNGKIRVAVDSPEEELRSEHITIEDKGNVIVGGSMVTLEAIRKAVEIGTSCLVVGGIRHNDVTEFMGEEIGVAITGQEEVGLTLIVTEGFGKMRMSERTFKLLKRFEGYKAAANGATQIRAGVMRPEIIIPQAEIFEEASDDELSAGMVKGTPVRIIRQPYFGAIGKVVNLPVELQQLESESHVRVLDVELDDGRVVTIPRANVEIIEE